MAFEWPIVRLGDHVDSCLGKMLDKEKNRGEFSPYLGNKNVRWGSFDTEGLAQMRFEEHEHDRYGLKYGDLIVCEGGEPGRCAIWKDETPGMKIQKALHRIRAKEKLDNRFLHYWFLLSGRNGALEPYFTGTTIKHLTGKAIAELKIPLPSKSEQQSIAHILGSLDDKIELNRQMNAMLEAMAQALFKSWFVDFDPVIDNALVAGHPIPEPLHARAEARKAALGDKRKPLPIANSCFNATLPEAIQKQFPSHFTFNEEMGWVPDGWEVQELGRLGKVITGKTPPSKVENAFDEGGLPFITPTDVANSVYAISTNRYLTDNGLNSIKNARIPAGTICVSCIGSQMGKTIITPADAATNQQINSINVTLRTHRNWLFLSLRNRREEIYLLGSSGSTMPIVNKSTFAGLSTLKPVECVLESFDATVDHYFEKILESSIENETLASLRDSLLPKLLSGQLRITDAEKLVSEVL